MPRIRESSGSGDGLCRTRRYLVPGGRNASWNSWDTRGTCGDFQRGMGGVRMSAPHLGNRGKPLFIEPGRSWGDSYSEPFRREAPGRTAGSGALLHSGGSPGTHRVAAGKSQPLPPPLGVRRSHPGRGGSRGKPRSAWPAGGRSSRGGLRCVARGSPVSYLSPEPPESSGRPERPQFP